MLIGMIGNPALAQTISDDKVYSTTSLQGQVDVNNIELREKVGLSTLI